MSEVPSRERVPVPTMQFTQHVLPVWSWLPAFRVVAETEHLPTAARELDVVPSSLSRSIKMLEEHLGAPLFDHGGKLLVLNDAGRTLLEGLRHAMRAIDDAVRRVAGAEMTGTVVAATSHDLSPSLLAAACVSLQRDHADLEVSLRVVRDEKIADWLLSGELDIAVVATLPRVSDLTVAELARRPRSVYGKAGTVDRASRRWVRVGTRGEPLDDGWPLEDTREVAFWAQDLGVAFEVCLQSDLVLTAADADAAAFGDRLVRLASPPIRDQALYVMHRPPIGAHRRTEAILAEIWRCFSAT